MQRAIAAASGNLRHPFGAVIADPLSGTVFAEACNRSAEDPTLHGEMAAIRQLVQSGAAEDWRRLTLYTTAEPCPMCMSAILWSGLSGVVYGTSIPSLLRFGWKQIELRASEVVERSFHREFQLTVGILERECDELFRAASRFQQLKSNS